MEKNDAVKTNRATQQWINEGDEFDEPKGLTDLSTIENKSDGFRSADPEAFKEIEKNGEFKKAFNDFVDGVLKLKNAGKASSDYVKAMENEIKRKEKDPEYQINEQAIDNARQTFLNHPEVKALSDAGNFDKETFELDIEKKYPKQMHEMKRMMSIGDGEKRAKSLMNLGKRLDVDDEKLRKTRRLRRKCEAKESLQRRNPLEKASSSILPLRKTFARYQRPYRKLFLAVREAIWVKSRNLKASTIK
jgi:hypothetical protein